MRPLTLRALTVAGLVAAFLVGCSDDDNGDAAMDTPVATDGAGLTGSDEDLDAVLTATDEEDASDDLPSWTPEEARALEINEATTIPLIDRSLADERVLDSYWLWDWWPVRNRDGSVAEIEGWNVAVALTAPADVLPGKRHDVATLRYLLSDDGGVTWEPGGELFADTQPRGSRQWAGSAMYDPDTGEIYAFYTAAGEDGEEIDVAPLTIEGAETASPATSAPPTTAGPPDENADADADADADTTDTTGAALAPSSGGPVTEGISYRQRMAMSRGTVQVVDGRPTFTAWSDHTVVLEDGGQYYRDTAGTTGGAGNIDAFRDPWFYRDPDTGDEYLLFTATLPDDRSACEADGVVGIARRSSDDLTRWELQPPLFGADCVNAELERPHIVNQDGRYHLLFTTHSHTFADDLDGPEGLYGFTADELFGDYRPLNQGGLVLANPPSEPYQGYSWMTLPEGQVISFFQYVGLSEGQDLSYIGSQSPQVQVDSFGGTMAPTVLIEFDDMSTELVEVLEPGQLTTGS